MRAGTLDAVRITEEALERIAARDDTIGAFRRVRAEEALAEARAVGARPGLADLPLAVKDVVAVAGQYAEWGSRAGFRQVSRTWAGSPRRARCGWPCPLVCRSRERR